MSETITLCKFVRPDLTPTNGNARATGHVWVSGEWAPPIPDPVPCERGYHGFEARHILNWIKSDGDLWRVEARGERIAHEARGDWPKVVCAEMRLVERIEAWNATTLRLFAADCAERVLPLFEREHPGDDRPRQAIEAARRFARGEATSGFGVAAGAAAGAAARAAEREWQTARLLELLGEKP